MAILLKLDTTLFFSLNDCHDIVSSVEVISLNDTASFQVILSPCDSDLSDMYFIVTDYL